MMPVHNSLQLEHANCSLIGSKAVNDDTVMAHVPEEPLLTTKGAVFLIADGLSSAEFAQQASRQCAHDFIDEYYHSPEMWSVTTAVQNTLLSINAKLYKKNHAFQQPARGYATTLTLIIVKSHQAYLFHIGDTRAYLYRDGRLEGLTSDHTDLQTRNAALTRAMGVSPDLQIDHRTLTLNEQDLLLLSTDGLHDTLSEARMEKLLSQDTSSLDGACQQLCQQALAEGALDNISCLLIAVRQLSSNTADELKQVLSAPPFPPPLSPGQKIDGYRIERELHASTRSQVYLVVDEHNGECYAMKTPSINFDYDQGYIERFCLEEWIGRRINSEHIIKIFRPARPKTFLYYLMEYVEGETLRSWMDKNPQPRGGTVLAIARQIASGLQALHQHEIVHRDLKPDNILIDGDGGIKIVDLGSVYAASIAEIQSHVDPSEILGTADYTAPEYVLGHGKQKSLDQFSLGVIIYELLTGQQPYGRSLNKCRHINDYRKLRYRLSFKYRADIPVWFDGAIRKACAIDHSERYDTLAGFIEDLQQPNPYFLSEEYLSKLEETLPGINLSYALALLWGGSLLLAILVFIL